MGAFYKLEESRLVQYRQAISAANADSVAFDFAPVPAGKIWVVTAFGYLPSVAETQTISIIKTGGPGFDFALLNPISLALQPAIATFIEQGMEYTLFPGEYISVLRGNHTAGSTMELNLQFIEIDQPLYTYDEPQIIKRQTRALSTIRTRLGGGATAGTSPMVGPRGGPGRPGGGGPAPI